MFDVTSCYSGGVKRDPGKDEALYDLAPEPPAGKSVKPASPAQPETLAYRAPKDEVAPSADGDAIRNFHMPLWLLGGGVAIEVIAAFARQPSLEAALTEVGLGLIVSTLIMLTAMLLAARVRQIDLGPFWLAVFKLAAIAIAPSAALTVLTPFLNLIPFGGLLGLVGTFVLYFALVGALFDLDESDTWYCVMVMFLVGLGVYFGLLALSASMG